MNKIVENNDKIERESLIAKLLSFYIGIYIFGYLTK